MRKSMFAPVLALLATLICLAPVAKAEPGPQQQQSIAEYGQAILTVVGQARTLGAKIEKSGAALQMIATSAENFAAKGSMVNVKQALADAKSERAVLSRAISDLPSHSNNVRVMKDCIEILGGALSPDVQTGMQELGVIIQTAQQTNRVSNQAYEHMLASINLPN